MSLQEKQLYLDAAKVRAEREDRAMREREVEREFAARKLEQQLSVRKLELELEREREDRAFQIKKLELELAAKKAEAPQIDMPFAESHSSADYDPVFDVHKNVRLVPPFSEKEIEKYFYHFERVALSLKWPRKFWTLMLQCVFTGKAREVYSALSLEQSDLDQLVLFGECQREQPFGSLFFTHHTQAAVPSLHGTVCQLDILLLTCQENARLNWALTTLLQSARGAKDHKHSSALGSECHRHTSERGSVEE
ncbi:uncharacterized protein [Chanodichthys erythropterus]|uniref:uncharacterized protein n=1 Tax=Chanodichthys erythropterus TaxID=933992 RepID=UPI00351EC1D6